MASVITPVLRHADTDPEHVAVRSAQGSWTYASLRDAALAYAEALRKQSIGAGDRVLLIAPTVPEFVIVYLGIHALGGVVVPVNTMSTRSELEYFIGDAGCSLVVAWHELGSAAAEAATTHGVPCWSLSEGARVGDEILSVVCDRASDDTAVNDGPLVGPSNYLTLLVRRGRMEGFIILDYLDRFPAAQAGDGGLDRVRQNQVQRAHRRGSQERPRRAQPVVHRRKHRQSDRSRSDRYATLRSMAARPRSLSSSIARWHADERAVGSPLQRAPKSSRCIGMPVRCDRHGVDGDRRAGCRRPPGG